MWTKGLRLAHLLLGVSVGLGTACLLQGSVVTSESHRAAAMMMYDFRTLDSVSDWVESSDTVREPGMSKGAFVLQKTQLFQRAVMFSLLNPQPNGAGFVGFNNNNTWDLSPYSGVGLRVRGQGDNHVYKPNAAPLNTANITTTTLQIVGGVYSDFKQH
ncbi:hypothetical protein GWK47_052790 [Chionoecetes opilio]|uniref:NADH:ubiquinone oxidoreductase intermediate-associated protein 30 domain-containing protein n=1 Tax=Chionoecetes opilio TaxID=41210 RepID=A0A8J4Y178_CHIOP|nr:hypothetical protein GWK47_052790 [Chionoecetes opilio]